MATYDPAADEAPYDYVDDNRLCKKEGCPASKIGPFGYCERHEPRQPWGERTYDFINRVTKS